MESDQELFAYLCSLERSLLHPAVRPLPATADLLADEFVEFGRSGRIFDKAQTIVLLQESSPVTITATEMKAARLAEGVVLITYRACRDGQRPVHSLRSSIWRLRGGTWQIVFHQGTPTEVN